MTNQERLLVLDAALVACEGVNAHEDVIDAMNTLASELDKHGFGPGLNTCTWGEFLTAQYHAVKKLAEEPEVFGFPIL